jgi:predicted nuclease of predicted toxin-antitoxin system
MKFLVDAQLPPAMARVLESHGHVVKHVMDINMHADDDTAIWDYALEQDMAVVTKDEDFVHRFSQGGTSPVIVWLRIGNTSRRALLQWFEPLLPQVVALMEQGERLVEVR